MEPAHKQCPLLQQQTGLNAKSQPNLKNVFACLVERQQKRNLMQRRDTGDDSGHHEGPLLHQMLPRTTGLGEQPCQDGTTALKVSCPLQSI